jgi:hypothetical protein
MFWREFEAAAPELARLGKERLERTGVALLGTVTRDGSPRISPVEPFFYGGHLLLGLMGWSAKARDLRRDERFALHSSVSDPGGSEGEFKLYGRAIEVADEDVRAGPEAAWWPTRPREDAYVVSLDIARAVVQDWDVGRGEMLSWQWSAERGEARATRKYP